MISETGRVEALFLGEVFEVYSDSAAKMKSPSGVHRHGWYHHAPPAFRAMHAL